MVILLNNYTKIVANLVALQRTVSNSDNNGLTGDEKKAMQMVLDLAVNGTGIDLKELSSKLK